MVLFFQQYIWYIVNERIKPILFNVLQIFKIALMTVQHWMNFYICWDSFQWHPKIPRYFVRFLSLISIPRYFVRFSLCFLGCHNYSWSLWGWGCSKRWEDLGWRSNLRSECKTELFIKRSTSRIEWDRNVNNFFFSNIHK